MSEPVVSEAVTVTVPETTQFGFASEGEAHPINRIIKQVHDIMVGNGWLSPVPQKTNGAVH